MAARRPFNIRDVPEAAIALGLVKNVDQFDMFGIRTGIVAATEADLTLLAATTIPLPNNAGQQLEIVSTDAADNQVIEFETLGPNAVELEKFQVQLNGTTPVLLPEPLISRINEVENADLTPFAGTVNIQAQGGGTIFGNMTPANQQMNQALFTVPAGKKWMVKQIIATMQRSGANENDVTVSIFFKSFFGTAWRRPFSLGMQRSGSSTVQLNAAFPAVANGPVDIKITAQPTGTDTTISAWVDGLLL